MRTETIVLTKKEIGPSEAVYLEEKIISAQFVANHLKIDFAKVEKVSSAALGILITYQDKFESPITFINVGTKVMNVIEILDLKGLWQYENAIPSPSKTPEA